MLHHNATHFLVPTNFGRTSRFARRAALGWALATGGRMTLLHVVPGAASPTGLDALTMLATESHELQQRSRRLDLEKLKLGLHPELKGFVDVQTELRCGDLIGEIVRVAQVEAIDIILLGARRWRIPWGTSLSRKLARLTDCHVVQVYEPMRITPAKPRRDEAPRYAARLLAACGWRHRRSRREADSTRR